MTGTPRLLALAAFALVPDLAHAQMDPGDMPGMDHAHMDHAAMGHSMGGMKGQGSGTARLPANEAMVALHVPAGTDDMVMVNAVVWPVFTDQTGPRGDSKLAVQSMAMAMATHDFGGARLTGKAMLSFEPAMRHDGYPLLFGSGESAYGKPLVDRQHPHDLFMELAARLDVDLAARTTAFVYGGPVGEPALGPSAFIHRASARYNPEAPITHHWFDSTHITYGVVTAGLRRGALQVEGSAFRGREPDERRWGIETPALDSWSARVSFAPSAAWLVQASLGRLHRPEPAHGEADERRLTVSAHYNDGRGLAAMAAFSSRKALPGEVGTAWLAEADWDLARHHTLFGRIENLRNAELFPDHADPLHDQSFRVTKLQAGYAFRFRPVRVAELALGGSAALFVKSAALDAAYGRNPMGYTLFARLSLQS